MRALELASSHEDGVVRVRVEGELDLTTAQDVERYLLTLEQEHQPHVVVLDLRGLRFLDSTGLRLILSADSRARRQGRRLKIIRGPEAVHRVFRIALLDRRLEFVDDRTEGDA